MPTITTLVMAIYEYLFLYLYRKSPPVRCAVHHDWWTYFFLKDQYCMAKKEPIAVHSEPPMGFFLIISIKLRFFLSSLVVQSTHQSTFLRLSMLLLRNEFDDILVYTGFEIQDIQDGLIGIEAKKCLDYLDVLIDGRYIDELNDKDCVLRGSSNQHIHFINNELAPIYAEYMKQGRILESFVHNQDIVGVVAPRCKQRKVICLDAVKLIGRAGDVTDDGSNHEKRLPVFDEHRLSKTGRLVVCCKATRQ